MTDYIDSSLKAGIIRPSSSPAGVGFFLVGKKMGLSVLVAIMLHSTSRLRKTIKRRDVSEQFGWCDMLRHHKGCVWFGCVFHIESADFQQCFPVEKCS